MGHIRQQLVSDKGSVADRFRERRWALLRETFPDLSDMRVLDLGGTVQSWLRAPVRPATVLVLNLADEGDEADWITPVQGDACDPPAEVRSAEFDLVYSNSVLEHVGGHQRRCDFAAVAQDLADCHWVQTPNRYFPIEPHYLGPGFQFLPVSLRARILTRWPFAHTQETNYADALRNALFTGKCSGA